MLIDLVAGFVTAVLVMIAYFTFASSDTAKAKRKEIFPLPSDFK
jgi:hypothetical protein